MIGRCVAATLLTLSVAVVAQTPGEVDETRAAWQFKREVALPAERSGSFVAIALPPGVGTRSQPGWRDLRLVDASGREAPFVVIDDAERRMETHTKGSLVEARKQRRDGSAWTVDFGRLITFDRLELTVQANDFTKRVRVEYSNDGTTWTSTDKDFWVFNRLWSLQSVRGTTLATPGSTARFVRLVADDTRSRPIEITGVDAVESTDLAGSRWTENVSLEPLSKAGGLTTYRVAVPAGFPARRLTLDADDPAFARTVTVREERDGQARDVGRLLVYRFRLPEANADVDARDIELDRLTGGTLLVDVADGDNPPLVAPRARLSAPQTLLVAATTAPALTLYYGNRVTRAPVYDIERLRASLVSVATYPSATLGDETNNPRYRAPAPLAFAPTRGAAVEAGAWSHTRAFRITGNDDIYSVTIAAADLAYMRHRLTDLRIVDAANRQVPYVVEPVTELERVPLTVTPSSSLRGQPRTSALTLTSSGFSKPAPFVAIEIEVAEGFFSREAAVLVPDARAAAGYRVVGSATLRSALRDTPTEPVVASIPLGGIAVPTLALEISDGDNAPLTIRAAYGLAAVPRITFKAGPGEYRLLFGNDRIAAPSYELGSLRDEVLAYSAIPVAAANIDASVANPDHTRALSDMLSAAPPTAVLWSALVVAVVALLALTRRILGNAPGDSQV